MRKVVKSSLHNSNQPSLPDSTDQQNNQFDKAKRLLTPRDYQSVFSNPVKFFQPGLFVLCHANNLDYSRLGLAVSKKNLPRAVDRNRIKRLIRESFRVSIHNKCVDVVVLTRNPIINMDNTQIFEQLDWLWQRINKRDW